MSKQRMLGLIGLGLIPAAQSAFTLQRSKEEASHVGGRTVDVVFADESHFLPPDKTERLRQEYDRRAGRVTFKGAGAGLKGQDNPSMFYTTDYAVLANVAAFEKRERKRLKRRLDFLNNAIRHATGGAAVTAMDEERRYVLQKLKRPFQT